MAQASVSALYMYPIKSLGGYAVSAADVEARGLAHDRRWMVVGSDGVFITQREQPRLALCRVHQQADALCIDAPQMPTLRVPLSPANGESLTVRVWRSVVEAKVVCDDANQWLTAYLSVPCRLVFMPDSTRRAQNPEYAAGEGIVSFADGYPLLVMSEASLADLNQRLDTPVPRDRFRPNIVVADVPAYDEDTWTQAQIGGMLFHGVKPCDRCAITTINQDTAERGKEPLATLAGYRKPQDKVLLGRYLVPNASGTVHVNDPVQILSRSTMLTP